MKWKRNLFIILVTLSLLSSSLLSEAKSTPRFYKKVPGKSNTHEKGKVKIMVFFDFFCPHCHRYDPGKRQRPEMTRRGIFIYVSLFIIFNLSTVSLSRGFPRIHFDRDSYDFGKIVQGKIVEHTFTFKNIGTADLVIKEVTTSCGCTAALVSNNVIHPGERGAIKVSYDSQGRAIKVTRKIRVVTNDPVEPVKELTIIADVLPSRHIVFSMKEALFSPKCGKCHAEPAKGKKGEALYNAICTYCHGRTAIPLEKMQGLPASVISKSIRKGVKGTEMPPWIKDMGGPLTEWQVESLVRFIKGKK